VPGGWRFVPFVYAIAVLVAAAVYWSFTYTDGAHHRKASWKEMLAPLAHVRVWRFSLYYFLVFGGYVALSLWLPKYYIDVYGFDLKTAALLTAIFVFPSGIIRAPGGWLSDRFGARTVMYWVLGTCVVTSFILMGPDVQLAFRVPPKYAAGGEFMHVSLRVGPWLFTALVFVLGLAMGIGKAAVYKHIPHYFPDRVGAVGGLVGVIGGLGGFVMPILFGVLTARTRLPTTTFAFLFALSVVCLGWMMIVVHQITRQAAPRVAEELDRGEGLSLVGAEMAVGGEILFAARVREMQARRQKISSGSE
jgi:NNP family nitrate/nitrite transporter-like MFS transporter